MATISRLYTFRAGTVADASAVNAELDQIIVAVNGHDGTANTHTGEIAALTGRMTSAETNITLNASEIAKRIRITEANQLYKDVNFDPQTGTFTFTTYDGSTKNVDTNLEKVPLTYTYDETTKELIITLQDGTKTRIPVADLFNDYTFTDTSTVRFEKVHTPLVGKDTFEVKAYIKDGSVGETQMSPEYAAKLERYALEASKSEVNAKASEVAAKASADVAKLSETNAKSFSDNAKASESAAAQSAQSAAQSAQSVGDKANISEAWAVGTKNGSPVVAGDEQYQNSSKFWAEEARKIADSKLFESVLNKKTTIDASSTDTDYPSSRAVNTAVEQRVPKEAGKGLSTNDYSNLDKAKVSNCPANTTQSLAAISESVGILVTDVNTRVKTADLNASVAVTIPTAGWQDGVAPYVGWKTNRVDVATMKETPLTRVEVRSGANNPATAEADREAYGMLYHVNTFNGYIIARALEVPTVDIPIVIEGV